MKHNIASQPKERQESILSHKKACLRRYYENMDKFKALNIKAGLERHGRPTAKSKRFIKRINCAKGYSFI